MQDWSDILRAEGVNIVGRDQSLLRDEEWQALDDDTVRVVRPLLRARQAFAPIIDTTLTGPGWTEVKFYEQSDRAAAVIDMKGEPGEYDLPTLQDRNVRVPVIHAEWEVQWRILEASRNGMAPLDVEGAQQAATQVAHSEDIFALQGNAALGIEGLLGPTGATAIASQDWSADPDNAYEDILLALTTAENAGFATEYKIVVNPTNKAEAMALRAGADGTSWSKVVDAGLMSDDDLVSSVRQTLGTATFVPMNSAYAKWGITSDIRNDPLPAVGRNPRGSTWTTQFLQHKVPAAYLTLTGI